MKKSLKEKLNKIKSKIDQIKYDKQKNDVIDFSNRKQRSKFYEELNKEVKDYNKNYQKILERREYLDKKEIERKNIEQKLYENSIEFEDERF